jgi:ArsR family transcriptional regulator
MIVDVCTTRLHQRIDVCQYRRVSNSVTLTLTPAEAVACCSPLSREPLSQDAAERIAPMLKALADPVRLRLLSLVASHEGGEACVCDLNDAFELSQPTISHHLKVLHEAGLLEREKRGVWVYYRSSPNAMSSLATLISDTAS